MQEATLSEVTIKVPANVADMITTGEIIILLTDKALSRAEYYRSKCSEMEQRHGIGYTDFKKKLRRPKGRSFPTGMICSSGKDIILVTKSG